MLHEVVSVRVPPKGHTRRAAATARPSSSQDIAYYLRVFRDELKRDPTTVECFDLAQGNSEHSRHWFFGGKVVIDEEEMPLTLFQWVKRPLKERISNSVIGFHDNSSALRGYSHTNFMPSGSVAQPGAFQEVARDYDITLTVETHNFPCGIAPFPGAETGAGGRIRDGESTGKGSLVVAAVAGYATGNLHIPGYKMPWEFEDFKYPSNMGFAVPTANQQAVGGRLNYGSGALVCSYDEGGAIQPQAFGAVDAGGEHLYAVQATKALWQVWDWNSKRSSYRASLPEKITAMVFSPDSSLCFAGAQTGSIYCWLSSTGALLRYWPAHFREVTQLLVSPDGGYLVSASKDSAVHVYNLADVFEDTSGAPKPFHSWSGHSLAVTALALLGGSSALHQVVASGSLDRTVRLWDVGSGRPLQSRSLSAQVNALCAGAAASELVVAGHHGELRSLETKDFGREGGVYLGHSCNVLSCAMSSDGASLASCSEVERVRVWETRTRQCVAQLHGQRDVKISAVKILRRMPHLPSLPPFQPFQRLLCEELPERVLRGVSGREAQLKERMAPYARAEGMLEHVHWASGVLASKASEGTDLGDELLRAKENETRWAKVANQLYRIVTEHGFTWLETQEQQVLIDCSNGASDYGNKFGEPLICGWTRSCGMRMPSGERFEWVKPIMLSGGLGQMDHGHLVKEEPQAGQLVVKIGGPAYRIGVGGGAASSMVAGDNQEELDFNAVQRGDAEMQQKVNRVVRACVELGPKNPILSIHDQGAGGSGNVLKEISEPAGAVIDLRKMHVGDPSMSFLELWTAEFQENNALLLGKESEALFDQICKREKVPYAVVGTITGDGKVVVKDSRDNSCPVDLPLDKVLGKMPQKVFKMQRIYKQLPKALDLPASLTVQVALETGVLRLLSVCSKRFLTNKVDRSVTGQIAQQQCVGPLQTPLADFACIAQSPLSTSGGATAIGEQPLKGLAGDPESCVSMARLAVAEALTNLAWIRIPTLDSIKASGNWMWAAKLPGEGPKMYDIAEALSHIMVDLGIAIDGGKADRDSLSMAARVPLGNGQVRRRLLRSVGHGYWVETAKSPGQFVLTVYAPVPDVRIKATPDLKTAGEGALLFVDLGAGPHPTQSGRFVDDLPDLPEAQLWNELLATRFWGDSSGFFHRVFTLVRKADYLTCTLAYDCANFLAFALGILLEEELMAAGGGEAEKGEADDWEVPPEEVLATVAEEEDGGEEQNLEAHPASTHVLTVGCTVTGPETRNALDLGPALGAKAPASLEEEKCDQCELQKFFKQTMSVLAEDKHLVGALDSACNRTCSGPRWLEGYLKQVREGPTWIHSLVSHVEEAERFKFGNGGLARTWTLETDRSGWYRRASIDSSFLIDFVQNLVIKDFRMAQLTFAQRMENQELQPLDPLTPQLLRTFQEVNTKAIVPYRWNRFILRVLDRRQWHARSLLIQFNSRSHLRYLPFPYPSVISVEQWVLQAQSMVNMGAMSRRHHALALEMGRFTATNLIELGRLRDRCGWKMAFVEDPLLAGFLAARSQKGQLARLKAAALEEAKAKVAKETAEMDREILARQLLGPRGGLPTLRADLVRLALLFNLTPSPKETVPQLQARIRPLVEILKSKPAVKQSDVGQKIPADPPRLSTPSSWSAVSSMSPPRAPELRQQDGCPFPQELHQMELRVQQMMEAQDSRFQDMLKQVLKTVAEGPHLSAAEVVKDDFKISGKVKPGIRQMISQAWDQHRRDQLAISVGAAEVNEIFLASWDYEMKNAMNETFALEVQLPSPFVTEIYTDTEPVAKAARRQGLLAGDSLTLSSGWDFRLEHHRKKGILKVKETKPYLVILAFPCGPWSQLQALNPAHDLQRMREEALILVQFAIEVAQLQLRGKRHYLMENPRGSLAWKLEVLQTFMLETDALTVTVDMCRFGLRALDGELHRKATQLVTSMQALVSAFLDKRCTGDHPHTPVMGESKVSSAAGHYTPEFAESVVQAALKQHDFETSMLVRADLSSFDVLEVEHEVLVTGEPGREDDEVSDASFEFSKEDDALVIPTAVKNAVYRLHVNTSHRSNHRLARALLIAGAPREAVLAAKRLKCAVCAERKLPRARPPASLPPPRDVGQQVHIDLVMLEDSLRNPYVVAHATDNVSRFQAAQVLGDKSTNSVIRFLTVHWLPLLGRPSTIVADQGREFVSAEFGDWCDAQSIYLYHIGVGAPWQNGICERSGATLKALVGATVQSHAISNFEEMEIALSEAVSAYNADVNEAGVAPIQLVTGRMPTPGGDVLNGFASRLAEHSLIEAKPTMAKLLAIRETSRLSMIRLHYSRGLRQAELARSRATTAENVPQPGDLVFFWRAQKYQSKKDIGAGSRRRLLLRRWHGPGLLVALEGKHGLELSANCFVSFRGQLAKCPLEHVRKASSLESIAAGSWEAAIDEVIQAAKKEAPELIADDVHEHDEPPVDQPDDPLQRALQPSEIVAALQPPASVVPSLIGRSSPPSLSMDAQHVDDAPSSAAPGTPVPSLILQASQAGTTSPAGASLSRTLERARALDELEAERGVKRQLEESSPAAGTKRQADENAALLTQHVALPAFEALVLTHGELQSLSERMDVHPLLRLQAQADLDRREGNVLSEPEHGTWDGRWAFLCERDWHLLRELGLQLPNGAASHDALSVQASRKEKIWSKMTPEEQKLWGDAAMSGWNVYVDNQAVKVLTLEESAKVRRDLADDPLLPHLTHLSEKRGWHAMNGLGAVEFTKLSNQHQLIDMTVPILITLFHPRSSLPVLGGSALSQAAKGGQKEPSEGIIYNRG
ncbi:Probable phosphoribosylformylglycinamidine synthase [Durusdinium trenchii]|uniref:Chloroplastic/mitochondrial (FGAM synthase) (FGAMS) (Formylglycinamide ribonucleotide amidotransferase) (FGAR amidotransferase) (FGAR-AT) (Formylglycinamide ribotide amidotransferase) n=1 Tax=Durusdinium trenchii TaxID=1381693 RepID=A0ABP0I8X0_9DINO